MKKILIGLLMLGYINGVNAQTDSLKIYYLNDDLEKALEYGQQQIEKDSAKSSTFVRMAKIYSSQSNYNKALKLLSSAELKFPNDIKVKYTKASILYKNKRWLSASKLSADLLKQDSNNTRYLNLAMKLAQKRKLYKEALAHSEHLLSQDTCNAFYHYKTGVFQLNTKQNKEALNSFEQCIVNDSTYADAYALISKIYFSAKQYDTALYYVDKAIEFEPDMMNFHELKGRINYKRGHYYRALPNYKMLFEQDSSDYKACFRLGVCYMQTKDHDKAHELFIHAHQLDTSNYRSNQYLGMSFYQKNDFEMALKYLLEAQNLIQPDPHVVAMLHRQLANAYFGDENYAKTIEYNKYMLEHYPRDQSFNYYIGESYFELGDYKNALKYFDALEEYSSFEIVKVVQDRKMRIKEHLFFGEGKTKD